MNFVKENQSSSSEDDATTSLYDAPTASFDSAKNNKESFLPFHDVYSILASYRKKNGGLDIPRDDEAMRCLIPALSKIGFFHVSSRTFHADESNRSSHQEEADETVNSSVHDKQSHSGSTERKSNSSASEATANVICDICEQKDGFRGYNLQICSVCGLAVHERCYGMTLTSTKNSNFVCKACAVIGSKVEVNEPSLLGRASSTKGKIRVQQRPTECVLCNVHNGIHAMHPLFDTHGPDGRQLVITSAGVNDRKLAWVHTLCANFICSTTGGSVYGCYGDDGRYEDDSDEEYSDEGNEVRFYAMATKDLNGKETAWSKIISDYRKSILCSICGKRDNSVNCLRIPLQCFANDAKELVDFKRRHEDRSECFVGMHVGCARWGESPSIVHGKKCKMCYFFDGDDDGTYESPQLACYCRKHAEDIIFNNPKYKQRYNHGQKYNSPRRPVKKEEATKSKSTEAAAERHSMVKPGKEREIDHQTSFKRGLTSIRKSKTVEKKRKFGASDESPSKRPRVNDDAQESSTVFHVQGRTSKILSSTIPAGLKRSINLKDDDQHQSKRFKSDKY